MGGFDDLKSVPIILLLTGVFFALAMIIMGSFQSTTVTQLTVVNETITTPTLGGNITLGHYRLVSITALRNATTSYPLGNLSIISYDNSIVQFLENATVCRTGKQCNITYTYNNYDTTVPIAIQNVVTAQSEIPSNWLLLIATVIAAAILIGFVMKELPMSGRE